MLGHLHPGPKHEWVTELTGQRCGIRKPTKYMHKSVPAGENLFRSKSLILPLPLHTPGAEEALG